jgi:hypothetical protein
MDKIRERVGGGEAFLLPILIVAFALIGQLRAKLPLWLPKRLCVEERTQRKMAVVNVCVA